MSKKKSSLRSKIEEALAPPELERDDDERDPTGAKVAYVSEEEDENEEPSVQKSRLRSRTAARLADFDPRYRGKASSRNDLKRERGDLDEREHADADLGHMFEMEEEEDDGNDEIKEDVPNYDFGSSTEEEDEDVDEEGTRSSDDLQSEESECSEEAVADEVNSVARSMQANRDSVVKKGSAIKNQLLIWEKLLESRIQLQKVLTKVNKLPQTPGIIQEHNNKTFKDFMSIGDEQHKLGVKESQRALANLLDKFICLQDSLFQFEDDADEDDQEDTSPPKKKKKLLDYSLMLEVRHNRLVPHRNSIIDKWNDKTRLSSGNATNKNFSAFETSTLRQIEHILSDKARLIARTQTKRTLYRILGCLETEEEAETATNGHGTNPEIFDDDDFYHQLLRELIDRKTGDVTDPAKLGRHWLQIQKMRSKSKKSVDTKASKGRKTRYEIHAKLVNFMAPSKYCAWKDDAKNELYSSLFGKAL